MTTQPNIAKDSETIGANTNNPTFDIVGKIVSLVKSFKPSAIGCNNPHTPTTVGPFLICIEAKTFLSAKVKNATPNRTTKIIPTVSIATFNIIFCVYGLRPIISSLIYKPHIQWR
jgi:hypothetical protein